MEEKQDVIEGKEENIYFSHLFIDKGKEENEYMASLHWSDKNRSTLRLNEFLRIDLVG